MSSRFHYERHAHWPRLSWVAECTPGSEEIQVHCGPWIESGADWFCEAVWDGPFEQGNFDQTDIVAGSGGRLRGDKVTFVSAGSILDRLHYIELDDRTLVSNSLSAILETCGASIDITYPHYQRDFGTVCNGLDGIKKTLSCCMGEIGLVYFENLAWDGKQISVTPKCRPDRDFSSFETYRDFMQSTMHEMVVNAEDPARNHQIDPLVPLSNGYDSPTVAVLAGAAGAKSAFTINMDRDGQDDSGEHIGEKLGYQVDIVDRYAWQELDCPEADCIAGSGAAGEVSFLGLQEGLEGRLLLTGIWAGSMWNIDNPDVAPGFPHHDGGALCLTELRLAKGFMHCPIPFWGGNQAADLVKVSQSEEMQEWSVGGNYDRPVPRRIVEEAGIPRGWFATEKHGSSDRIMTVRNFLSKKSMADYSNWTTKNSAAWLRQGRIPPHPFLGQCFDKFLVGGVIFPIRRLLVPLFRRMGSLSGLSFFEKLSSSLRETAVKLETKPLFFRRYTFPWALEKSRRKYRLLPASQ